ncbi:MAG: tripartite tricarboxylate transporter substrate binding protein [Proteobacteria bacterium]|nr:tripartite tricarboxylate transporter substrate binding protein [Burkholderiales bacterium]
MVSGAALAQPDWPSKPISIVVPFAAGGGTDLFARVLGAQIAKSLGQPVLIDNRPGASGNIGAEAVYRAAPDGHAVLYTAASFATATPFYPKLAFDAQRDFRVVTIAARIPHLLVVHPSLPVKSVKEFIALAKKRPDTLVFASTGMGSMGHLTLELFQARAGVSSTVVHYRGAAPAATAVLSGEASFSFLVPPVMQQQVKAGKLRALGTAARERAAVMPDVATFAEQGLTEIEANQWHGVFVHAKVPAAIVDRLHRAIVAALAVPEVRARLAAEGGEAVGLAPNEATAFYRDEIVRWGAVMQRAGIRPD